jgi:FdrA protein
MLTNLVKKNFYRDSVFLMSLSNKIRSVSGVLDASVMMGTDANKKLLSETGFFTAAGESAAPGDLMICVNHEDGADVNKIASEIEKMLEAQASRPADETGRVPAGIEDALEYRPDVNIALISIPGAYVRFQAEKLLKHGVNLMIFSDNVSVADEIHLKKIGAEKELLVMGPDCGTAIINGVPLGFANVVRKGGIGIAGASGTGIQEVTTIIHKNGQGITHAIGTGGRDLSLEVGGLAMIEGIKMLAADPDTKIICIISKPPAPEIEEKILGFASKSGKPLVVNFIGSKVTGRKSMPGVTFADTLEGTALAAIAVLNGRSPAAVSRLADGLVKRAHDERKKLSKGQKYIRGLFSGGTLCDEALFMFLKSLGDVYSNLSKAPQLKLKDSRVSFGHSLVDLGDDEFTRGVPHPMIDFTVRNMRLVQESKDPDTVVILFDLVLGYGANADPAGAILPAINEGKKIAADNGRYISFVASICGTDLDPQGFARQKELLEGAGVNVLPSNVAAAKFTEVIVNG